MTSYRNDPAICNSDINNLEKSEELFLKVRSGEYKTQVFQVMLDGTLAHCEILTPEKFWDEYYIKEESLSPKQKEFVENLLAAKDKFVKITPTVIEEVYKAVYTKPKEGDGMVLYNKLERHIKGLYSRKEGITMAQKAAAEKRLKNVNENPEAKRLLELANIREEEIFFEMYGVKCKSKIDAHGIIEEERLTITVDLKIAKEPTSNEEVLKIIKDRKYDRQTVFYDNAIKKSEEYNELYPGIKEFKSERYIIHVDPVKARVIKITDKTAEIKQKEIEKLVKRAGELCESEIPETNQILEV